SLDAAKEKAHCDFGQFVGGGKRNSSLLKDLSGKAAGLKLYLDQTYGDLKLDDMTDWLPHFSEWPANAPLAVHAEGKTLGAAILLAATCNRLVHLCHVSRREEILIIKAAKENGIAITCEVCPHHLFLTESDIPAIGQGLSEVRPRLATEADRDALWENMDVIDCFATDHAPHTLAEKDGENPPPGFPGLETILPLLLTSVNEGRLTLDDLTIRLDENPRKIFNLPMQDDTFIEVDLKDEYEIRASDHQSRCGWTPYEGWRARGRVRRVEMRGRVVYEDGEVLSPPGFGKNVRSNRR
ncbi:MAG: hypothetical protein ACRDFQ_05995, partial [Anaerolineales bacterium]